MLGLLHPRRWKQCLRGHWIHVGSECAICRDWEKRRYANAAAPKLDQSIVVCPGKGRTPHPVLGYGINPQTGFCVQCTPLPPKPQPKPATPPEPELAPREAPARELPRQVVISAKLVAAKARFEQKYAAMLEHAKAARERQEAEEAARRRERSPAEVWLLEQLRLGGGSVPAGPTAERARASGFSVRQLRDARERLTYSEQRNGLGKGWTWVLVDYDGPQDGHLDEHGAASRPEPTTFNHASRSSDDDASSAIPRQMTGKDGGEGTF